MVVAQLSVSTHAVLVTWPEESAVTVVTVTTALTEGASDPTAQETVCGAWVHVPCVVLALRTRSPFGSVSVTVTSAAAAGPSLPTLIV